MFGVLAVYQAMLPLLRESSDARIVNVSSGVGSLTTNADPAYPYHAMFGPVYPASKAALNAITLAMMIELESTEIKVNLVSPGFTKTNLNGYAGTESVEDGSREVVRVALLGPDGPTGTFTRWENVTIPVVTRPEGVWPSSPKCRLSHHRRVRRAWPPNRSSLADSCLESGPGVINLSGLGMGTLAKWASSQLPGHPL